jgi:hypothetical protein
MISHEEFHTFKEELDATIITSDHDSWYLIHLQCIYNF